MKREVHHPNTPTIATFSLTDLPSEDIICCTCVVKLSEANLGVIRREKTIKNMVETSHLCLFHVRKVTVSTSDVFSSSLDV